MGHIFVKRNWEKDRSGIEQTFESFKKYQFPAWIVSFVEGSRFSSIKKQESKQYCVQNNYPPLEHVLFPRSKGFTATMMAFKNSYIKVVYDFTIAFQHDLKGFGHSIAITDAMFSNIEHFRVFIDCKRYLISELPNSEEGLSQWLKERYYEKDAFLKSMKYKWSKHLKINESFSEKKET